MMEGLSLSKVTIYDITPVMMYTMGIFAPIHFDVSHDIKESIIDRSSPEISDKNAYMLKRLLRIFRIMKRR